MCLRSHTGLTIIQISSKVTLRKENLKHLHPIFSQQIQLTLFDQIIFIVKLHQQITHSKKTLDFFDASFRVFVFHATLSGLSTKMK